MAAADTPLALGAVTRLVREHLLRRGFEVSVGRPEDAALTNTAAKLNLFLYATAFDPQLRNVELRAGDPPPLWMILKYLLTAFDADERSDSIAAHDLLGQGIAALQELSLLRLVTPVVPTIQAPLQDNPEPLKLSFEDAPVELLTQLMQGSEERYRLSVAFQVRPVLIMPAAPSRSTLLVGINYDTVPPTVIGRDGVSIDVIPSLGPQLERVEPTSFEAGAEIELFGADLHGEGIEVALGEQILTITEQRSDRLAVTVEGDPPAPLLSGNSLSAGQHGLVVRRRLSSTRVRSGPVLLVRLLPTVISAALVGDDLQVTGHLLGRGPAQTGTDDVVVALFRDGATVQLFDAVDAASTQDLLIVPGVATAGLPAGEYLVIVKVNNQQARSSPRVTLP